MGRAGIHKKLKWLKTPIREWNKKVFGKIEDKIQKLEQEIQMIDDKAERTELNEIDLARNKALQRSLYSWRMHKAQLLRQYSRSRELTEKDCNSKFFHAIASYRRSKKTITRIKIGGI